MVVSKITTRPTFAIALAVMILLAAACGGSDDSATSDPPVESIDDAATADPGDAGGEVDTANDDADSGNDPDNGAAGGPVGAVVVIGGERFEATQEIVCVSLVGALSAKFTTADGSVEITISLPPEDWETSTTGDWSPPRIRVDDNNDPSRQVHWEAGSEIFTDVADAQVESFSVDGKHASGSATVVDLLAPFQADANGDSESDTQPATFEVTCA